MAVGLKGTNGTQMNSIEVTPAGRKRQQNKAKRFEQRCRKMSGPVKTRKLTPEELSNL
ncbi:hypothetical protein [Paraeggerthella sp. Marseille-Q4926]|uniref:hypothetical protein n=1 Tax=Paraeggerthella sp. Marseille-Q4926 TaxID=2866587 RepID=UPI001CE3BFDC|nr:hypothetical protein [Paraeggerthella sp. Marseille-Q4926]